ncbi:MAG: chemotaxis response regulator protein-glutamate methylesterase [Candidatus Korobacteraceae bacterium]|jgi:two-component system chemotaxis response regulator CheB
MDAASKIRVLIAEDSSFMRRVLKVLLSSDPQIDIVGEARDGVEALLLSEALNPDVITMDINMPRKSGLEATEQIMSTKPRPIVIVSSEAREGAEPALRALELGAIDFVAKPANGVDLDMESVRDELLRKVKIAAKVRVVRTAARRSPMTASPSAAAEPVVPRAQADVVSVPAAVPGNGLRGTLSQATAERFPVVVLAASTGGPAALMNVLPQLRGDFPGAVLLIQHMPASFTTQFSRQLAETCAIRVKEAEAGELMRAGTVYLCPGANHMRVSPSGRLLLDDGPRINGHRPSADLTLESVADYAGPMGIAVVLTGMGNDGAKGVQALKTAGGHSIAQDESTSIIFGMPSEAIRTGAVDEVVPLDAVCNAIERRVSLVFGVGALRL